MAMPIRTAMSSPTLLALNQAEISLTKSLLVSVKF